MSCQKKIAELEAAWADRLAAASAGGAPVKRDDLKRIEGIGPKIEKMLNDDQIFTWAELATTPLDRLKGILRRGGDRYKMHDPSSWPDQAKLAAASEVGHGVDPALLQPVESATAEGGQDAGFRIPDTRSTKPPEWRNPRRIWHLVSGLRVGGGFRVRMAAV